MNIQIYLTHSGLCCKVTLLPNARNVFFFSGWSSIQNRKEAPNPTGWQMEWQTDKNPAQISNKIKITSRPGKICVSAEKVRASLDFPSCNMKMSILGKKANHVWFMWYRKKISDSVSFRFWVCCWLMLILMLVPLLNFEHLCQYT